AGCRPENIVGWLAHLGGLAPSPAPTTPRELAARLRSEGGMPWERLRKNEKLSVPDTLFG
ncbi:MAG: hypothetical protein IJC28_03835, partial [Mailhella sp.]|nr:hypothetical protein [Mailhella sp.]